MARRTSIIYDGKEYVNTEIAAPAVNLSIKRLRELANGYRTKRTVPCIKEQRQYFFHIPTLRDSLKEIRGIDDAAFERFNDSNRAEEPDYLEGL